MAKSVQITYKDGHRNMFTLEKQPTPEDIAIVSSFGLCPHCYAAMSGYESMSPEYLNTYEQAIACDIRYLSGLGE